VHKLIRNKKLLAYIVTLQEAFAALIPYFLLLSFVTLLQFVFSYFSFSLPWLTPQNLHHVTTVLNQGASVVVSISIAYFLAERLKVSQAVASILSVATILTIVYIETLTLPLDMPKGFTPAGLINPILATFFLYLLYPYLSLRLPTHDENKHIYRLFNYVFVFMAAYVVTVLSYMSIDYVMDNFFRYIRSIDFGLPDIVLLFFRDLFVQISWFLGIHGDHTVNALFGKALLDREIVPNLTYAEFNRLFVVIGGSGVGAALLIAMWLYIKDRSYRLITNISIPFVIFNINTLLIYAIVVLNRYLFIPFVVLPLMNILVAYGALQWMNISFHDQYVVWMTPVFFDSYVKTGGSLAVWLLQAALLAMDTFIYAYFIKRFIQAKEFENKESRLMKNLDVQMEVRSQRYINAYVAHKEIIEADAQLDIVLDSLYSDKLYVYYQPKIALKTYDCNKFEALLRFNYKGKIIGPIFLDAIEKAGLAPIIDMWVVKQVKHDLYKWSSKGFYPQISVNLHPDTIQCNVAMDEILHTLRGENVIFEIIERSFLAGSSAQENLYKLKKKGFALAIDDFGTGYSSLETLVKHRIDELKLDKSIIDIIETSKGRAICKNMIVLCHELGSKVVAEGVEEEKQLEILKEMGADFIQGFYFSKAIPFDQIVPFTEHFLAEHQNRFRGEPQTVAL